MNCGAAVKSEWRGVERHYLFTIESVKIRAALGVNLRMNATR